MKNRLKALAAVLLLSAACQTGGPSVGRLGGDNYAAGSALGAALGGADEAALAAAFIEAVERGAPGVVQEWRGPRASGAVTPGAYLVGNLWPDRRKYMALAGRIDLNDSFETELGLHALTRNANVRSGPSTEAPVLGMLAAGTAVDVVGRTVGKPWALVAVEERIRGYVHASLMIGAPGADVELAGGPTRRAARCRAFEQSLAFAGETDRWSGVACDRGQGWRLEEAPQNAPAQLY